MFWLSRWMYSGVPGLGASALAAAGSARTTAARNRESVFTTTERSLSRATYDPVMLAARYERTGPAAEVIEIAELPLPDPGPGEVRVRIACSGVNPTDWKSRAGSTAGLSGDFQVPNQDGSGTIDAVGDGVDSARVGERVWIYFAAWQRPWGTAAEYSVVPADHARPAARQRVVRAGSVDRHPRHDGTSLPARRRADRRQDGARRRRRRRGWSLRDRGRPLGRRKADSRDGLDRREGADRARGRRRCDRELQG